MPFGLQGSDLGRGCIRIGVTCAVVGTLVLGGCGAPALPTGADADSPYNIAGQILPGDWGVVDETVIFSFNADGLPVAISNPGDPDDWKTNIEFGTPRRIETPVGALDFTFEANRPVIDSRNGDANYSVIGTGTNINALGIPVPGSGYATAVFTGSWDESTGQLAGTIRYEVYYESVMFYSDEHQYTLVKIE